MHLGLRDCVGRPRRRFWRCRRRGGNHVIVIERNLDLGRLRFGDRLGGCLANRGRCDGLRLRGGRLVAHLDGARRFLDRERDFVRLSGRRRRAAPAGLRVPELDDDVVVQAHGADVDRRAVIVEGLFNRLAVIQRLLGGFRQDLLRDALDPHVRHRLRAQVIRRLAPDHERTIAGLEDDGRVTGLFDGFEQPRRQRCME